MHQEHNIPWNTLASNFKYIYENPAFTPRRTALFPRDLPNQASQVTHFSKALENTITEFSRTERAKYPETFKCPVSGKLFSDELMTHHPKFLNPTVHLIENWIADAKASDGTDDDTYSFNTSHGDLADVVKILIHENEMSTLLMLAHHLQIPLIQLRSLSWGHHFGFSRVAEAALAAYLSINHYTAADLFRKQKYKTLSGYQNLLRYLTDSMDYDGQQVPHRNFMGTNPTRDGAADSLEDIDRLRDYLKILFSLLYRYDMLVRECGAEGSWLGEIIPGLSWSCNVKWEWEWREEGKNNLVMRFK